MSFKFALLDPKRHNRAEFSCGKSLLDVYIRTQANQDIKRNLTSCWVLEDCANHSIVGYYTLCAHSVSQQLIPDELAKKLPPSYSSIPTMLLGRLAVDERYHGQGFGEDLLMDALHNCYIAGASIGVFAVVVDPLDEEAEAFYEKFGFIKLPDSGKMFIPMATIEQLFDDMQRLT